MKKGFTLVELVIVIAIVIVLSVVSVPIYRSYVDKAKLSEAYALLGTLLTAQKAYYSEYGNFLVDSANGASSGKTSYDPVLGVDARGNKYFTQFDSTAVAASGKYYTHEIVFIGNENLLKNGDTGLIIEYNITLGSRLHSYPSSGWTDSWSNS